MAKKAKKSDTTGKGKHSLPVETAELRKSLDVFFASPYDEDPITGVDRRIGAFKWGVYIFFDYDGEPIYVGQTRERVSARIRRHLTNQRTDAVAMSVLDPFEVYKIRVYPCPELQETKAKDPDGRQYLNAMEHKVHGLAIAGSKFSAILNEKNPPEPTVEVELPTPFEQVVVSDEVFRIRAHDDVRIARRAQIISRLAQIISERGEVSQGLRRTLKVQAIRLQSLAEKRFGEFGGEVKVEVGPEDDS